MAQTATHPLVRSFLSHRRTWADNHRRNAISILNRWCAWLAARPDGPVELCDATRDDCNDYLRQRELEVSSSTAHKDYQQLVWLYEWLAEDGELPQIRKGGRWIEPPARGPMTGVVPPRVAEPLPERVGRVDELDYRRLMASFDKRLLVDCRDAAMLSLMWKSGPRRHEVAGAQYDRLDMAAGSLEILGKNRKWRKVPLAEETMVWLERYLRKRRDDAPALFASTRRRNDDGALSPEGISEMLDRRADKAAVPHLSTHQFRRAAACDLRLRGLPDVDIIKILGWDPMSGMRMLTRYTRADGDDLAVANFHRLDTARRSYGRRQLAVAR